MSINKEVLFKTLEYTTAAANTNFLVWTANSDDYAITTYLEGSKEGSKEWSCSIDVDSTGGWKINNASSTESKVSFLHSGKSLYINTNASINLTSRIEIKYGTIAANLPQSVSSITGSLRSIPNGTTVSDNAVNNLNVQGNVNVSQNITTSGNVNVNGTSSNVAINGSLNVSGSNATVNLGSLTASTISASEMTVSNITTSLITTPANTNLTITSSEPVTIDGNLYVENIIVNGNTNVSGNAANLTKDSWQTVSNKLLYQSTKDNTEVTNISYSDGTLTFSGGGTLNGTKYSGTSADADKLGGHSSSYYATSSSIISLNTAISNNISSITNINTSISTISSTLSSHTSNNQIHLPEVGNSNDILIVGPNDSDTPTWSSLANINASLITDVSVNSSTISFTRINGSTFTKTINNVNNAYTASFATSLGDIEESYNYGDINTLKNNVTDILNGTQTVKKSEYATYIYNDENTKFEYSDLYEAFGTIDTHTSNNTIHVPSFTSTNANQVLTVDSSGSKTEWKTIQTNETVDVSSQIASYRDYYLNIKDNTVELTQLYEDGTKKPIDVDFSALTEYDSDKPVWADLFEFFREKVFKMGKENMSSDFDGSAFVKGRFLFNGHVGEEFTSYCPSLISWFSDIAESSRVLLDSFVVEIFGANKSAAECTMTINAYTKMSNQHYYLQVSTHDGHYYSSGWQYYPLFFASSTNEKSFGLGYMGTDSSSAKRNLSGISFNLSKGIIYSPTVESNTVKISNNIEIGSIDISYNSSNKNVIISSSKMNYITINTNVSNNFIAINGSSININPSQGVTINPSNLDGKINLKVGPTGSIHLSCIDTGSNDYETAYINVSATSIGIRGNMASDSTISAESFNATSDIRLKYNIKPVSEEISASDIINKTNLYTFSFLDKDEKYIGVIAQELQDIDIEGVSFVAENADGYLSVKESKFVYLLMKAFKEQSTKLDVLEARIKELEERIDGDE